MSTIKFGDRDVSSIILGTMRIPKMDEAGVTKLLNTSLECGVDFIDTADIYGGGRCEELLGESFSANPGLRDKFYLQSKCGIRRDGDFTYFDFSKEYILDSVDGILRRLKTDHLDALLLHRPDALMEPEEVADAFNTLEKAGKVLNFGVSNFNPMMIELLKKSVKQPIIANQLQLSAAFAPSLEAGFHVNMEVDAATVKDSSIMEYCRLHDITIQAWSSLQYGFFKGTFVDNDEFADLNKVLARLAEKYNCTKTAVALAWILRYPGSTQAVIGTTNTEHLKEAAASMDIKLTKKEWYEIYLSAGRDLP